MGWGGRGGGGEAEWGEAGERKISNQPQIKHKRNCSSRISYINKSELLKNGRMLKSTKEENMNTSAYDSIIPMTGTSYAYIKC